MLLQCGAGCRRTIDSALVVRLLCRGDLCQQAINEIYNVILVDRHHARTLHRTRELAGRVLIPPARHTLEDVPQRHDVRRPVMRAGD